MIAQPPDVHDALRKLVQMVKSTGSHGIFVVCRVNDDIGWDYYAVGLGPPGTPRDPLERKIGREVIRLIEGITAHE